MKRRYIRIVAVPPGEAPEEVRKAWVGVRMPLLLFHNNAKEYRSAGVLTGPRSFFAKLSALFSGRVEKQTGYPVAVMQAIAALEAVNPEAAKWWRENTPHLIQPSKVFLFPSEVCVEEPDSGPK
jgi:hypothetical protein